ncbi:MAG: cytochrome c peroxidase [Saprospiraceae bacterium]
MLRYATYLFVLLTCYLLACGRPSLPATEPAPPAVANEPDLRDRYARPVSEWPAATLDSGVIAAPLGPLPDRPPVTARERAAIKLGKQLFFDPRLSSSNQISCSSCHDPERGWGDGKRQSVGHDHQLGARNAPTLLNTDQWTSFFWDGRAATLQEQVMGPLTHAREMNENTETLSGELQRVPAYAAAFKRIYGTETIQLTDIAEAIVSYEQSIRSRVSRFDQFMEGNHDALTEEQIRGLHLFRTKARCLNCHNGPLFSDQQFHNNGQHLLGRPQQDLGRFEVTGDSADLGKVRTPMLRDIFFTGPYLHHGNILELHEVITMYNNGMPQRVPGSVRKTGVKIPVHDPLLRPLHLTDGEMDDLLAFLESISTRPRPVSVPQRWE